MKLLRSISMVVLLIICAGNSIMAQTYFRITSDTARIVNGELIIGNQTQSTQGVLINKGNGVTQFQKLQLINIGDSLLAIAGQDTLQWSSGNTTGKYYVLSKDIPLLPYRLYHPLVFEAPLDSGKMYRVRAMIYLNTPHLYDTTSILQSQFSNAVINDQINVYNVGMDTTNGADRYFLELDKFIQSNVSKDTFKLYFKTNIDDASGNMDMDSLSYLYVEKVSPKAFLPDYTVDTPEASPLQPGEYYVLDSAKFNFTPVMQNVTGYTDVIGDPSKAVITATAPNGWTISTVGTDSTLWNPDPYQGDSSSGKFGQYYTTTTDPFNYTVFDSAVMSSGFINYNSQYVPGTYNLKIGGLHPSMLYQITVSGSTLMGFEPNTDVASTRTYYTSAGKTYGLNTSGTTSRNVVFDTLTPDASGNIYLAVAGMDSTYYRGSRGIISGMSIYEISKDSSNGSARTQIYRNYFDTISIYDGVVNRLCAYYKPYNFDNTKKYGLIVYFPGQESTVEGYNWDIARFNDDGLGLVASRMKGKIYGIDANGDTVSYFILIPESSLSEWSLSTAEANNVITKFQSQFASNLNNNLYLAGFSSGGWTVERLLYNFPSRITSAIIQSPAPLGGPDPSLTVQQINDTSAKFSQYGIHVWTVDRNDAFQQYTTQIDTAVRNYCPNCLYERDYEIDHRGFAYEYLMDSSIDPIYEQTFYDFFADPTKSRHLTAYFSFDQFSSNLPYFWQATIGNPSYLSPAQAIISSIDTASSTGWKISTLTTSNWTGTVNNSNQSVNNFNIYRLRPFYVNKYAIAGGYFNAKQGGYKSWGPNLEISNLKPDHPYRIIWSGLGSIGKTIGDKAVMTWGIDSTLQDQSVAQETILPVSMNVESDANGKVDLGFYPSTGGSDTAFLAYLIVRDRWRDSTRYLPVVNAGIATSISSVQDTFQLAGIANNRNLIGGNITNTTWNLLSQPVGNHAIFDNANSLTSVIRNVDSIGVYKIELSATDSYSQTVKDTLLLTKLAPMAVGDRTLIDLITHVDVWNGQTTTSPQPDGRYWNNVNAPIVGGNNAVYANFVDTAGISAAGISITTTGGFLSYGVMSGSGASVAVNEYPVSAVNDGWKFHNAYSGKQIFIRLPKGTFSVKFWGSYTDSNSGDVVQLGMRVGNSGAYTYSDEKNNASFAGGSLSFTVTSDGSTPIEFDVDPSTSTSLQCYINLIDIIKTAN